MSAGSPQVRLANEIAAQFRNEPEDEAAKAIATHIRAFWDPRMKADLFRHVETGQDKLDPLVLAAARLIPR
ncbi:formate dehydrogenase subunit delta [Amycolatopsis suaedae]|uniref:Formate dehydrogenase n=1 Tax=Amycolatopsis suaedae TaxID=2510978 RepID=A0A4Q7IYL2_9PSEU|nr:formate dehydrogenase subunit delta [Amycolatopsis suaedae]RZQ60081.1 formate dehydrogenase [Amycolatopsis suaedae]